MFDADVAKRLSGRGENLTAIVDAAGEFAYLSDGFAQLCADYLSADTAFVLPEQNKADALLAEMATIQASSILSLFYGLPVLPVQEPWKGAVRLNGCSEPLLMEITPLPVSSLSAGAALEGCCYMLHVSPCSVSVRMQCAGRFARGLAHDFNNALASIMGFAELAAGQSGPEGNRELLKRSVANVLKGCERAGHVLERARTVAGRVALEKRPFQPEKLLERWYTRLSPLLPDTVILAPPAVSVKANSGIPFRTVTCQPLPTVHIDIGWLDMAFEEVWKNALAAMPSGGKLQIGSAVCPACGISVESEEGAFATSVGDSCDETGETGSQRLWIVLWIEDSGYGMSKELQQRAVEPFYTGQAAQAERRGQADAGGQGWGLSLAWGVLAAHGGRLEIDSVEGGGCRVYFWLPAGE
ncbi:ATP-binding protein [Oleidesulfovibrio sp.]|uniref:ATP-binding protein n=1 Tax=Oleidesulfovibrio sp. TaxID=2909707 RepID=UPI003A8877D3